MATNNRILILDDEPEALKGYEQFLTPKTSPQTRRSSRSQSTPTPSTAPSENEFLILKASTGEEAVALFKKEKSEGRPIAAGFFDVKLGDGIDGLETIRQIKEIDDEILCVVVTAYQDRSVDDIGKFFGEDFKDRWDFLSKPFTQGEIVQKARQMVAAWNRKHELKATQKQLITSEKMAAVGQVARGVGHEFGNILLRILGKADLATMETDAEKMKAHLEVIVKAAERAGVIIKNLQSFSTTENNTSSQKKRITIETPIQEALSLINHEFIKHSITVNQKFSKTPDVEIDVGAFGQVFLNLFINAMHAMSQGGQLTIETKETGPTVTVCVKDSGSGIDPKVINDIFEFAFSTKGEEGSGLGLSITKQIIDAHQGSIRVQSKQGTGTEFIIQIPKA